MGRCQSLRGDGRARRGRRGAIWGARDSGAARLCGVLCACVNRTATATAVGKIFSMVRWAAGRWALGASVTSRSPVHCGRPLRMLRLLRTCGLRPGPQDTDIPCSCRRHRPDLQPSPALPLQASGASRPAWPIAHGHLQPPTHNAHRRRLSTAVHPRPVAPLARDVHRRSPASELVLAHDPAAARQARLPCPPSPFPGPLPAEPLLEPPLNSGADRASDPRKATLIRSCTAHFLAARWLVRPLWTRTSIRARAARA